MDASWEDFWAKALQEMYRANVDKKHPFRQTVLATTTEESISQRVVIHRMFKDDYRSYIFTDSRSKKVLQLIQKPVASLLFYHPKKSLQISVQGTVSLQSSSKLANNFLEKLPHLDDYSNLPAPGEKIDAAMAYEKGEAHFMLMEIDWKNADVLELNRKGHKRIQLSRSYNKWKGSWVVP